jgi:hypothetical protein
MRDIKDTSAAIYIPSAYKAAISKTTKTLAKKFGGTTNVKAEGTWVNEDDELIKEEVTIIRAWYAKSAYLLATAFIIDLAVRLREECKQDCIAIEVEGEMILV